MAEVALPVVSRSAPTIQADIDRTVARLRALRAEQANAYFTTRPAIALKIQTLQDKLDRLYEEKRAAHAERTRRLRHEGGNPSKPTAAKQNGRRVADAQIATGLFADSVSGFGS